MATDVAIWSPLPSTARTDRTAGIVVARVTARAAARSGVLWGLIFGVAIASSEISYTKIYTTATQRRALADAYGSNKSMSALFGPAPQLQTVGGFTAFKISMTLMVLGAVWALLTSTRLLRGEEDAGRWDLLLVGQTTRRRATLQAVTGLGAGALTLWAISAIITIFVGRDPRVGIAATGSLLFASSMASSAVMFLAVGALTSQLAATRRQAASIGAVVLGVSYALRLIADAGVGLRGLIWATPLGWTEELQPLTNPQPLAFVPIIAFTAVVTGLAVSLSGRRDVGKSMFRDQTHGRTHLALMSGPTGLAIRMLRARVVAWWLTIAASALLFGLIARSAGATISGSSREVFSKLGVTGSGANAVLGACFLVLAVLVAFVAAGQLSAARAEEVDGTLDHLLVRPVSRSSWLGGRLVVSLVALLLCGALAGVFSWAGAVSQHADVSLTTLLGAGLNIVPPAIVVSGIGVVVFGIWPRLTSVAVYGLVGWSLLLVIVGSIGASNHWLLDTSVFHHMASAPAVSPNWAANGVMVAIGGTGALIGRTAFLRRDIQGA